MCISQEHLKLFQYMAQIAVLDKAYDLTCFSLDQILPCIS